MPEISAIALFGDDIRVEQSGAYSIMGIVGDNIAVPSLPGALPKFAIYVRIHLPSNFEPCDLNVFINFPNGNRILVSTHEKGLVEKTLEDAKSANNPLAGFYSHLVAAPFPFEQEGRIWLELLWDGGSIYLGSLNVIKAEDNQPPATPSISSNV